MLRHERQVLIPGWDQDAIRNARVTVCGTGAIGSILATNLARLGVGEILVIDPDVLKEHNLENQAFTKDDLGRAKVHALRDQLAKIDATLVVKTFLGRIQDLRGELPGPWIFGCVDNVAARHYLNHLAVSTDRVLIDGGIESLRGVVQTVVPWATACLSCQPFLPPHGRKASCSSDPVPSTYLTASTVANLQAVQFLKLLRREPYRAHVHVDLARGAIYNHHFTPNPSCEICGGR